MLIVVVTDPVEFVAVIVWVVANWFAVGVPLIAHVVAEMARPVGRVGLAEQLVGVAVEGEKVGVCVVIVVLFVNVYGLPI